MSSKIAHLAALSAFDEGAGDKGTLWPTQKAGGIVRAMRTALDVSPDSFDEGEQKFVASVRKHGWSCTSVHGEAGYPGFSYTTGLWLSTGKPEFILFGMPDGIAYDVLSDLFHISREGRDLPMGTRTANLPAYAFPVAKRYYPDHLGWCGWFYDSGNFPCVQIVWPDRAGVFPWESGFDKVRKGPGRCDREWLVGRSRELIEPGY